MTEVIDLTAKSCDDNKEVPELTIEPDLFEIAKQYNVCVVVKNKSQTPNESIVTELTTPHSGPGIALEYGGISSGKLIFIAKSRQRKKYVGYSVSQQLNALGPLINYQMFIIRQLNKKKKK